MNRLMFTALLLGNLLVICTQSLAQDVVIPFLTNTQTISGYSYRCDEMVQSLNRLRHFGKDRALKILEADLQTNVLNDIKIVLICRLLFENPSGWKPLNLGAPEPLVQTNAFELFPLFPLSLSDGTPFFLVKGYNLAGRISESASDCLNQCAGFAMISVDLRTNNYGTTASSLIQSQAFQKLYIDAAQTKRMAEMILTQAKGKQ